MIEESEYQRMILVQRQAKLREERSKQQGENDRHPEVIHISYHKKTETQIHLLMQYLSILKTQLPSMPHHHLITVLFSPSHENLLLINEKHLLAGLTFYRIEGKRAFELSLMAASESNKGYGAILVNHLKSLAQLRKIRIIATHADDSAIGFYQKMGFSMIEYTENKVLGEKEFSNSTIMQTRVSSKINYGQLRNVLKKQKEHVMRENKVKSLERVEISCNEEVVMRNERLRMDPSRLVGVANFWEEFKQITSSVEHRRYKQTVSKVDRLIQMADPALVEMPAQLLQLTFLAYDKPIELITLKENAAVGKYETDDDFNADLSSFIANCRKFYSSNHQISQNLTILQEEIEKMAVSI